MNSLISITQLRVIAAMLVAIFLMLAFPSSVVAIQARDGTAHFAWLNPVTTGNDCVFGSSGSLNEYGEGTWLSRDAQNGGTTDSGTDFSTGDGAFTSNTAHADADDWYAYKDTEGYCWECQYDATADSYITVREATADKYADACANVSAPGGVFNNLQLWLKANVGVTAGMTWKDQSPNGLQASGGNQPSIVADAINFNTALNFNGSSNFLTLNGTTNFPTGSSGRTIIAVATSTATGIRTLFTYGNNGGLPPAGNSCALAVGDIGQNHIFFDGLLSNGHNASTTWSGTPQIVTATYSGNFGQVFVNGLSKWSKTYSPTWNTTRQIALIGQHNIVGGMQWWTGKIAEIILYNKVLSAIERQQVNSYLSLKYGSTLDSIIDYLASDGTTVIYPSTGSHSGYINDIVGIGRDDNSSLDQRKSKSISTDAIVTIEHSSAFDADKQFLTWGNDNGSTTEQASELPPDFGNRLGREWKVAEINGDVGDIVLNLNVSSLSLSENVAVLLIDSDGDSDFTTGTITQVSADTYAGGIATFTTNLGDGDVFTLATGCAGMSPNNVVDNLGDVNDCNNSAGNNTLLEAITNANAGDTITFASSIAGQTITLASQLDIAKNLTIDGQKITISGNNAVRVFNVTAGTVTFKNLTIVNGSTVSNGGAIQNADTVIVLNSTFTGNSAANGGAIHNAAGTLTVKNSTFSTNTATTAGGAINVGGGTATLINSTLSSNTSATGANLNNGGTLHLKNTIIANGITGSDCNGSISTNTNNLIKDGTCSGGATGFVSGDPLLSSLADNGGTTQTMALLVSSPAINAGDNAACETTDQRGETRPKHTTCDIGAYEYEVNAPTSLSGNAASLTQINLSWIDNSTDETSFKVERSGALITTTAANVISYSNSDLYCGTTYNYSVKATNVAGDSTATSASVTTLTCPLPPPSYELIVEKNGGGTVSAEGIDCGSNCLQSFFEGTEITLIATPYTSNSYVFDSWSGDCDETGTVLMSSDKTCTANFVIKYTLTLKTTGKGTIENCGINCIQTHSHGETLSINTTPDDGWAFRDFTGDCDSTGQVLMDGDKSCTVRFLKEYTLTLNTTGEGTIDNCGTECTQTHVYGETVSLTATPTDSWNLNDFTGDCDNTGQILINGDKSCTATFVQESKLNITSQNGTVTGDGIDCGIDCTQTYPLNTSVILTAIPEAGFIFTGWAGDCVGTEQTTTLTLDVNKNCTAIFVPPCLDTQRLYVNQSASGQKTGCDWANAIIDLQSALTQVTTGIFPKVNEIWVAKGTYLPTTDLNREATFQLLNGISIYGGFSGNETEFSLRGHKENQSILSGDIGVSGDNSDNSYHVVTGSGTNATALLHGFIITGGNASKIGEESCPTVCGGGLYNDQGSPSLNHLSFTGNSAMYGGGIYNSNQSYPTIKYSFIENNTATNGAGIYNDNSHPLIKHVFVKNNRAFNAGGGMYNRNQSAPKLTHFNFSNNEATTGGGLVNDNSDPVISHSIFRENQATNGGAMVNLNNSQPLLSHLLINSNIALASGSVMLNNLSQPTISQTTIAENFSTDGGIINIGTQLTVNNSILWHNHHNDTDAFMPLIIDDENSVTTVNYSIIQGGWAGEQNVDKDPLFVNALDSEVSIPLSEVASTTMFHLQKGSPAIDSGHNDLIPQDINDAECVEGDNNTSEVVDVDFEGKPRQQDGDGDNIVVVDMGAYETSIIVLPYYPLTIAVTGEGKGTVISTGGNLNCGINCTHDYRQDDQIRLIATAEIGAIFMGWSGACSGTENDVMVEMTEAKNCKAQFEIAPNRRFSLPGITLICEDCNINNAALAAPEAQPVEPGNYSFPQGLVSFELTALENPQTHLHIYYHNTLVLDDFVYRKYGPTIPGDLTSSDWYSFPTTISLDTLDGQTMVKASLVLTDGALGDNTGIDGSIVDPGGIALEMNAPIIPTTTDAIIETQPCSIIDNVITKTCNVEKITFSDKITTTEGVSVYKEITIAEGVSISNAIFEGNVENKGLISNSTIESGVTLTRGKLTGYIVNNGTLTDVEFVGSKLSGGLLSGTIRNNSEVGGIIENVTLAPHTTLVGGKVGDLIQGSPSSLLQNVQLMPNTVIIGGHLSGRISGDPDYPAQIGAATILQGTTLSNMRLSPTVRLPEGVIFGPGVILPSSYDNPIPEDFGINPSNIPNWTAWRIPRLEPAAFSVLSAEQIGQIPLDAFQVVTADFMSHITEEALAGFTKEQLEVLPEEALSGLTSENMGGLTTEVIEAFTPEQVAALNEEEFKQLPSEEVSEFMTNLAPELINTTDVEALLPLGWTMDPITGAITAPIGAKLTLRLLPRPSTLPQLVFLPKIVDLNTGLGLGGRGLSLLAGTRVSLQVEELGEFLLSQDENGILWVEGTGKYAGQTYTFIPDADHIIQVDGNKVPVGISIGHGGFYKITTPDSLQYPVIPAPQNPVALSAILGGSQVVIGERGDVLMEIKTSTRQRGKARQVAIFEPLIELAPDDLCVEIEPGEVVCDFDNAPESMKPGLHFDNTRSRKWEQAKVVFPNGTAQTIRPTLLSPKIFAEVGFKLEGVEEVLFNSNGVFYAVHKGTSYLVVPNFKVDSTLTDIEETEEAEETEETLEPSIVVNEDETLTYTIAIEPQEEVRTRKRGKAREVLEFEPLIELAPDDLCVEITPDEIICDFDNMLE
ncbi:choice-of-anchor Q domain-containing protein [Candidatus Parabeggiatoa sp. HSG14]|uniref:InlB B-repeat-containing protein n=1 Tax=Candidatus Parabeggiatoa sp. HSG14 TaxID=3055593 RepID=UPI0025A73419|nr:choice-of-anchor Q domain-containing protein [Thiotrichales bacterium HSG14]